jgi:uncharacterized protein involved in exopolysaccharide biosynthesis
MSNDFESNKVDNEINLAELFASIWAHKFAITFGTVCAIIVGSIYALTSPKVYVGTAEFALTEGERMSLPGVPSAIAALAGISGNGGPQGTSPEAILYSRSFIQKVSAQANLVADRVFNTYQEGWTNPLWKVTLKGYLGLASTTVNLSRLQSESVFNSFSNLVVLNEDKTGSQSISVSHANPERAAEIANDILDLLIAELEADQEKAQTARLTYLSSSLADALQNTEKTQENLKEYALNNNMLSVQAFTSQSVALDNLRKTLTETEALLDAVEGVATVLNAGNVTPASQRELKRLYPVVDDASFRRLFGMTEVISEWSWPEASVIAVVASTLTDRIERLGANIVKLEAEAQQFGQASEELFKLEREAKIAEATYTVLIEQVKAQSLNAGFKPEIVRIYDRAIAPIRPSSPNVKLIVAITTVLGAFGFIALSLIASMRRDVYWTDKSLSDLIGNPLLIKARGIRALRGNMQPGTQKGLRKISSAKLSQWRVDVSENPSNVVLIANLKSRISSVAVAEWLAMRCSDEGESTAVLSKSFDDMALSARNSDLFAPLMVAELSGSGAHFALPISQNSSEFYSSKTFKTIIEKMRTEFDRVIIASDEYDTQIVARVLRDQKPHFTIITRVGASKKSNIRQLADLIKVDACIYE